MGTPWLRLKTIATGAPLGRTGARTLTAGVQTPRSVDERQGYRSSHRILVRALQWNVTAMEKETRISLGVWHSRRKEEVRHCMDLPYVSPEPVDFGWTT